MTELRVRAERAANTVGYGLATGAAGAVVGVVTGGVGWMLVAGGTAAVAGAQVGRTRPSRASRRHAKLTAATARRLAPLSREGWHLIHARPIGQDPDRVYHLCVPPSANLVVTLMDWDWPKDSHVRLDGSGALHAGPIDGSIAVDWVLQAADTVANTLHSHRKKLGRIGVTQVLPVHDAAVAGGHVQFHQIHGDQDCEINIVQAGQLLKKMRTVPSGQSRSTRRSARDFADFLDTAFP
ncbi:hypothetical protein ABT039_22550 [Streptomyces lasiicapitis]|uniref:hypothetical protein n=1 Tax=Streptomyces lasiicapitis TaxID=1923961 RepID=UPI00331D9A2E